MRRSSSQFVVEAIAEDLEVKRDYFERIEDCVTDDTILASNSSTFTVSLFGENMRNTERAVVTHWFNPPHIVPTVEVVPGPRTTEEVIETSVALHRRIGKLAIRINGEIPGFLVNRVQNAMIREVWDLYERGIASAEDAWARIRAGASLVQLYSAMVYEGPGLPRRILRGVEKLMRRDGFASIAEAVGSE